MEIAKTNSLGGILKTNFSVPVHFKEKKNKPEAHFDVGLEKSKTIKRSIIFKPMIQLGTEKKSKKRSHPSDIQTEEKPGPSLSSYKSKLAAVKGKRRRNAQSVTNLGAKKMSLSPKKEHEKSYLPAVRSSLPSLSSVFQSKSEKGPAKLALKKFGNYPIREDAIHFLTYVEEGDSQENMIRRKKRHSSSISTPVLDKVMKAPQSPQQESSKYELTNNWHLRFMLPNAGFKNRFHTECISQAETTNFQLEQNRIIREAKLENTRAKREKRMLKCKVSKIMRDKIPELHEDQRLRGADQHKESGLFNRGQAKSNHNSPKSPIPKIADDIKKQELKKHLNKQEYKLVTETHPKYYLMTGEMIEKDHQEEKIHKKLARQARREQKQFYRTEILKFYEDQNLQLYQSSIPQVPIPKQASLKVLETLSSEEFKQEKYQLLSDILRKSEDEQDRLLGNRILRKYDQKDLAVKGSGSLKLGTSNYLCSSTTLGTDST
ncbi:unnamed protein product [Moneuplotes crassus]|uniref:Uncharacterized protein n=1 Tax=Euplotes crassus TaxID=5936 RepID=A0AAD1U253_EUPCR|nr:unnamed protein product [Moneuplotes crassus]